MILKEESHEEYLSDKCYYSASDLKKFLLSPQAFLFYRQNSEVDKEESKALMLGTAIHVAALEPDLFHSQYRVIPKVDRRTKEGKQIYQQFLDEAQGRTIINQEEHDLISLCSESIITNDIMSNILRNGGTQKEISAYNYDLKTMLPIKMRPDILCNALPTIVDIKTIDCSNKRSFSRAVDKYSYDLSAAFYLDFLNKPNYLFCAVEKTQPHTTSIYSLEGNWIQHGRNKYRMALDLLKWSSDNNYWCDYAEFELLKSFYIEHTEGCNLPTLTEFLNESTKTNNRITKLHLPNYLI